MRQIVAGLAESEVTPEVCVVVISAVGLAIDSQAKSEIVITLGALEIRKLLLTALAGLNQGSPGLVATSLHRPAPRIRTLALPITEQMSGEFDVMVVLPPV